MRLHLRPFLGQVHADNPIVGSDNQMRTAVALNCGLDLVNAVLGHCLARLVVRKCEPPRDKSAIRDVDFHASPTQMVLLNEVLQPADAVSLHVINGEQIQVLRVECNDRGLVVISITASRWRRGEPWRHFVQ